MSIDVAYFAHFMLENVTVVDDLVLLENIIIILVVVAVVVNTSTSLILLFSQTLGFRFVIYLNTN